MTSKVKGWEIVELKDIAISLDSRRVPLEASVRKSRQGKMIIFLMKRLF
jgi:hypothetical protein